MSLWSYKKLPPYFNKKPKTPTATKAGWKVTAAAAGTRYGEIIVAMKNLLVKNTAAAYPTFTATQPSTTHYTTGQKFTHVVVPSKNVFVSGLPTVQLTVGANTRQAVYNPATSTPLSLKFDYTIVSGDFAGTSVVIASTIVRQTGYGITIAVDAVSSESVPAANLVYSPIANSNVTVN